MINRAPLDVRLPFYFHLVSIKLQCLYLNDKYLHAGPPSTPADCLVTNKSYESLVVTCSPPRQLGLPHSFVVRVSGYHLHNVA